MPDYRGKLPHFQPDQAYLFLTWRLWGSPPPKADEPRYPTPGHAFVARDRALDKLSGSMWLKDPRIAEIVASAILIGEAERQFYELSAWVMMPNHVHLLILPRVSVAVLMRWLKGSTARSANRILKRTGQPFWQDESYDHYLRHSGQMGKTIAYIEQNPVSAGLVHSGGLAVVQCWLAGETACPTQSAPPLNQNVETRWAWLKPCRDTKRDTKV